MNGYKILEEHKVGAYTYRIAENDGKFWVFKSFINKDGKVATMLNALCKTKEGAINFIKRKRKSNVEKQNRG